MRLLILTLQYPPDVNSTGMLMQKLGTELVRRGHVVDVVAAFPHYAQFKVEPPYRGRLIERTTENGLRVTRVWVAASGNKQRMWHRLASYLSYNVGALLATQASARDYDVALATTASFFTGATATVLGALRGFRYVYNVQDIYPDVPVRAGQLSASWQVRGLDAIGRWMMQRSARVTVISEQQKATLLAKGIATDHIEVIPNFVDVDTMRPLPRDQELETRFGWRDKFVVMHGGNIGYAYDFDAMLGAARELREHQAVRFVLVGDGVRKAELEARARAERLENVQFLPFLPEAELPRLRSCADLQVSLYRRGSSQASLPSKLYEIMASGKPVLASAEPESEVAKLVQRAQAGVLVEPESPSSVARAVLTLQADRSTAAKLGTNGRAFVVQHHSLEAAADAYETLLRAVAGQD